LAGIIFSVTCHYTYLCLYMTPLASVNKYFVKYKWLFILGFVFIVLSNYFKILSPQVTKYVLNTVETTLSGKDPNDTKQANFDPLVKHLLIDKISAPSVSFKSRILICGIILLGLALFSGLFMFLMRQTIIVMSRHIEYDQKNEIFAHYLTLDTQFYKTHATGDLMNRISEDVSRVRSYTGPAVMYIINLAATIGFCVYYMLKENVSLTLYVLSPLPILAIIIYYVNTIINKKSDRLQSLLSDLTTNAQESYSGIRVIKSFVQEASMLNFFRSNARAYRKNAISLAKTEAFYFPSISLLIGLSTILTILIGGMQVIRGEISIGVIGEFVMYILMLTFPVSAIGLTASMMQRAATSQARINEFLHTKSSINVEDSKKEVTLEGDINISNVSFTYPHTGIQALKNFSLHIRRGQKIAIIGKTGAGKTTVAQILLRVYDVSQGEILYDGVPIKAMDIHSLRSQVSYVPQDVFLFSDTIEGNIAFGSETKEDTRIRQAAQNAVIEKEINGLPNQFKTLVGERGVTLSGGQKQRISIARALVRDTNIVIFDDCLSAVDAKTEKQVINNLAAYVEDKTTIIITHRIFSLFHFDKIIVLKDGQIAEEGNHSQLMNRKGYYYQMLLQQQREEKAHPANTPEDPI
jgi:ATP-binding cassette, subfamily B, multidrug efflux pump